jgi:hypothetical protein
MGPFAARTLAGFGQTSPVNKDKPTLQALCRLDMEFHLLQSKRAPDMGEVIIDLFLTNLEGRGQVPGAMLVLAKKRDHVLANGLHGGNGVRVLFHAGTCTFHDLHPGNPVNPV